MHSCLSDGCECAPSGGGAVTDQYLVSSYDCVIIILMTAVFSPLMPFEMYKATPEVSKG